MGRANAVLLVAAVLYPVASFALLRWSSGITGIPGPGHWVMFGLVLPAGAASAALAAKLGGARLAWGGVAGFAAWMAVVGWCHHWLITAIWAVI